MSLPETMRDMWCEQPETVELRHVPVHEVGDDDVLVKVAYAAICPWDVRAFSGLSRWLFPASSATRSPGPWPPWARM